MTDKDTDEARGRAFHTDPRELILEAARRSSLFKEVSAYMWFITRNPLDHVTCPMCQLLEDLTDLFDKHVSTRGVSIENLYAPSDCMPPRPGTAEAADFAKFMAQFV